MASRKGPKVDRKEKQAAETFLRARSAAAWAGPPAAGCATPVGGRLQKQRGRQQTLDAGWRGGPRGN